jgi:aminocarboxymuconate-semialdehyde decarboxylase
VKIDIYSHIVPKNYRDRLYEYIGGKYPMIERMPTLVNLEDRLRIMDRFEDLIQVAIPTSPPIESIATSKEAVELARVHNDGLAEIVAKYPDRFPAAVATLPMNDIEAALKELDRAITELRFRGINIHTPVICRDNEGQAKIIKQIDQPEFMPIYERMAKYNLPIWIHPFTSLQEPGLRATPDYIEESKSEYRIWQIFGWPYLTTVAMTRLIFSGVLEKYPNLKFIAHHAGAMVPFFETRISEMYNYAERSKDIYDIGLTKKPLEYFRMFFADTAINGSTSGLECAYRFYGAKHLLFGTDMPYEFQMGYGMTKKTIESVERMDISGGEKQAIFEDNARELLRLPV